MPYIALFLEKKKCKNVGALEVPPPDPALLLIRIVSVIKLSKRAILSYCNTFIWFKVKIL